MANRAQERKTMSQDPQGRSPGSLQWEAMGWDLFFYTKPRPAEDRTESRRKGEEDETESQRQRGKARFIGSTITSLFGEEP